MIYCFDIDDNCKTKGQNYSESLPIHNRIKIINKLYDEGNTIIFSQLEVCNKNWLERVNPNQLEEWNVKYHELILGKPNADVYVDDKAINDLDFFNDWIDIFINFIGWKSTLSKTSWAWPPGGTS